MVLIASVNPSEILKPSKEALNPPTAPITSELSSVLGFQSFSTRPVRSYQFNSTSFQSLLIKTITVKCFITNKAISCIFRETTVDGIFNKRYFVGLSTFHVSGDRKTRSVCNCHDLGTLATFRFANSKTPFFAGTNDPSIKASWISIPPLSYRSWASS
jgi:hypothetical protein